MQIVNRDFTKYKKLTPIFSVLNEKKGKDKIYDVISTINRDGGKILSDDEINDYCLGKNVRVKDGLVLPDIKRFSRKTGEHGDRVVFYISGTSNSGKTYQCAKLAQRYNLKNPKNEIFWISPMCDNKDINKLSPHKINCIQEDKVMFNFFGEDRIRILNDDGTSDFDNSLVIVDDLEGIQIKDMKLKDKVIQSIYNNIINPILSIGRHHNISLILVKHLSNAGHLTREILNECDWIILFPYRLSEAQWDYFSNKYFHFDKKNRTKYKDASVLYYHNNSPTAVLANGEITI